MWLCLRMTKGLNMLRLLILPGMSHNPCFLMAPKRQIFSTEGGRLVKPI